MDLGAWIFGAVLLAICLCVLVWSPRHKSLAEEGRDFLRFDRDRDLVLARLRHPHTYSLVGARAAHAVARQMSRFFTVSA